ncbi:MAG: hypothetical protein KDA89_12125 [Planctomycetaceae bacterium]|nr:hypothetical protein [Planctomycetaceae bacterium]
MESDGRTVRVFTSSTFRGIHWERDWPVKVACPALREDLEMHRVHLVDTVTAIFNQIIERPEDEFDRGARRWKPRLLSEAGMLK